MSYGNRVAADTDDSISCEINGLCTRPIYLRRGLRQGCNLSPILFTLFVLDVTDELNSKSGGILLWDTIITHLIFADDYVVMSSSSSGLSTLLKTFEDWCVRNRMEVSVEKSKIVSSTDRESWPVLDLDFCHK